MKIRNPKAAGRVPIRQKALVDAFFNSRSGDAVLSFDDFRAHFGKTGAEWSDGMVHQLLIDVGYGDQVGEG